MSLSWNAANAIGEVGRRSLGSQNMRLDPRYTQPSRRSTEYVDRKYLSYTMLVSERETRCGHWGVGVRGEVIVCVSGVASASTVIWGAVGSGSEASFRGTSETDSTNAESVGTTVSSRTLELSRVTVGLVDLWQG
jgi:hypothetical protein